MLITEMLHVSRNKTVEECSTLNTLPDWLIVENIIPRNVIIKQGAAEVDNHISRDEIFDYHSIREYNIYFIIPNIRSFIFYRLRPTQGKIMHSLFSMCMNENTNSFGHFECSN